MRVCTRVSATSWTCLSDEGGLCEAPPFIDQEGPREENCKHLVFYVTYAVYVSLLSDEATKSSLRDAGGTALQRARKTRTACARTTGVSSASYVRDYMREEGVHVRSCSALPPRTFLSSPRDAHLTPSPAQLPGFRESHPEVGHR